MIERDSRFIIHNKYEIVNYIGKGSYGKVYLVEDIDTGEEYALKVQDKKRIDEE